MSLTLTDNRGFEADQLDIELDDADGQLPRRGVLLELALGWQGEVLFTKGSYTVDEIEYTDTPDRLVLRARSADFRQTLNIKREKSWHKTTVGEMVKDIAVRHRLEVVLGESVAKMAIDHLDQTNESDASFTYAAGKAVRRCCMREKRQPAVYLAGVGQNRERQGAAGYHHSAQRR